ALAGPVLKHRMALTFSARSDGQSLEGVIAKLVGRLG
ncbi:MAG: AAA family ATPase, partial [Hansschlegelia sp.]